MIQNKILWIENDEIFLHNTLMLLEQIGLNVEYALDGEKGIELLKKSSFQYSLILLDLDMGKKDGIQTFKEIRKINSRIPIIIVSAHLGEPYWEQKLKSLGVELNLIEKPFPMVTSKDFETIINTIKSEQNKYLKNKMNNPFAFTFSQYSKLSSRDREKLNKIASEINSGFVSDFFDRNPDIDWITIATKPGKVIKSGASDSEPLQRDLKTIAHEIDSPLFTYTRAKIVDEINPSWSKTPSGEYYPTVLFEFRSRKNSSARILGDFDTGSEESFVSYEEFIKKGIVKEDEYIFEQLSTVWGEQISYYRDTFDCALIGKTKEKPVQLVCNLVKNWDNSPLTMNYDNRIALIGRDLLLNKKNKLKIILDGENKRTDFL